MKKPQCERPDPTKYEVLTELAKHVHPIVYQQVTYYPKHQLMGLLAYYTVNKEKIREMRAERVISA